MYCRKEMVKILKCSLIPKKSYGTLSKGAIFLANPVYRTAMTRDKDLRSKLMIIKFSSFLFNQFLSAFDCEQC